MVSVNDILRLTSNHTEPFTFYYGQGGIGDFLLLMSTFYDALTEEQSVSVVFAGNNKKGLFDAFPLKKIFPKVESFHILDSPSFDPSLWAFLENNPMCLGTGVTPKNFDYRNDWIECGKSSVFDYYGVKRTCEWASDPVTYGGTLTIQPFGGSDDQSKEKAIPLDVLAEIFGNNPYLDVALIGSPEDAKKIPQFDDRWITGFSDSIQRIRTSEKFVGTDSWGKTFAALAGVKDITIYPNKPLRSPEEVFGHPVDPGDYVFLREWGFEFYGKD